ncbi:MAG: diaminopimelate epimerase [Bacteroidales bacterium]|nr:diaminopimelate epimerase [Bacteroidales bacterium]
MKLAFSKYHGTGNDFIMVDNRKLNISLSREQINYLCDRHLGIGADGLILMNLAEKFDFEMHYFNSDGGEGTMCGNGGRCITAFAWDMGIKKDHFEFLAIDGIHQSKLISTHESSKIISIKLADVNLINHFKNHYFINTGSPHYIEFVKKIDEIDVRARGRKIRWNKKFMPGGTNVNFAEIRNNEIHLRTFERGVEDITLSCGTGSTATAIAAWHELDKKENRFNIHSLGGILEIQFEYQGGKFTDIWLTGTAMKVFEGQIEV